MSQSMPNLPKPMISLDRSGSKRPLSLAAAWLFSAVLLFAQAVDLSHNHEGNLQAQFDCDICLVTGSLSDALAAGVSKSPVTLSPSKAKSLLSLATRQYPATPEPHPSPNSPLVRL